MRLCSLLLRPLAFCQRVRCSAATGPSPCTASYQPQLWQQCGSSNSNEFSVTKNTHRFQWKIKLAACNAATHNRRHHAAGFRCSFAQNPPDTTLAQHRIFSQDLGMRLQNKKCVCVACVCLCGSSNKCVFCAKQSAVCVPFLLLILYATAGETVSLCRRCRLVSFALCVLCGMTWGWFVGDYDYYATSGAGIVCGSASHL